MNNYNNGSYEYLMSSSFRLMNNYNNDRYEYLMSFLL